MKQASMYTCFEQYNGPLHRGSFKSVLTFKDKCICPLLIVVRCIEVSVV